MNALTTKDLVENPRRVLVDQVIEQLLNTESLPYYIDLSLPYNMYLVPDQARSYLELMNDKVYSMPFHDPVRDLLKQQAAQIFREMRSPLALVDLGPGYPDKTLPLFTFLVTANREFTYFPVDISTYFLDVAVQAAHAVGVGVHPINCLFEELPDRLSGTIQSIGCQGAVIIFGLTFMNYKPERVSGLIKSLLFKGRRIVIASELRGPTSENDLLRPYQTKGAETFNLQVLRLAGFGCTDFEYQVALRANRIEMGFVANAKIPVGSTKGEIPEGTFIQTAVSYRYTLSELAELLGALSPSVEVIPDKFGHVALAIL